MPDEIVEKPVYKTGDSLGSILKANEASTSQPAPTVTPTPSESVVTPSGDIKPAETPITPETTPTSEPNVSNFKIEGFDTPETPEVTVTTTQPESQPQVKSWKEALSDENDRKEILKELGITDFALEVSKHQLNGGDPADYFHAKAVDYNKMSDESLLKDKLTKENPFANPDQINLLYKRKYGTTEDMVDEDKEFMELQQKSDAYKERQQRIAEQAKFKIAAPIQFDNKEQEQKEAAEQQRQIEAVRKWYAENEATKSLMTSKRVALNLGDNGTFNFNVERPELLMKAITDTETWQKLTSNKQGEPDVAKMQKIALYAFNPEQFENDLVSYGKSLALPGLIREGQNIAPSAKVIPVQSPNVEEKELWKNARTSTVGGGRR